MADETAEQLKQRAALNEKLQNQSEERLKDLREEARVLTDIQEIRNNEIQQLQEEIRLKRLQGPLDATWLATQREKILAQKELNKQTQLALSQGEATADALSGLLGVNKEYNKSMLGSIDAVLAGGEAQEKFAKRLRETMTAQNIAYSFLLKFAQATGDLMKAQDAALVSFNKQTGATRLYGDELSALENDMYHHGVTMEDAAESYGALSKNVYGLKNMSSGARKELSTTTALLNEFGVSADTTAGNVQFMTRSIGVSVGAATKYQRELFSLSQEIGMPPAEMAEGFKAAAPKLAAFGKDMGKVFKKLAVNARAAGMEVDQMLNIVEQFDTFEGAAQSVGKLNALLGGPFLNSMEMVMTTDPTERMRMLSGALNDAGKSFDQMSYYEKKSIAAAAGLSDVSELALVMAGSFDKSAGGAHKSQAQIQKLAEQTAEFQTIQEELMQTFRMFAIQMRPVINVIKAVLQGIQDLNKNILGGRGGGLIGIILGLMAVWMVATRLIKLGGVALKIFNSTAAASSEVIESTGEAVEEAGKSAGRSAPQLLALGAAAMMMGVGIAFAAIGMAQFVMSFKDMDASQILAISAAIAVFGGVLGGIMFAIMSMAAGPQGAALAAAVAVFILMGLTVAVVAVSMGLFATSMALLFSVMTPAKMTAFAAGMVVFISQLVAASAAAPAIAVVAIAVGGLALAMAAMDTTKMTNLAALFTTMSTVTAESARNIMTMGKGVGLIAIGMTAMALNPLAIATVPALLAGATAVGAATAAATSTTYASDSPEGLTKKSGTGAAGASSTKVEVVCKIEVDPKFERFFKASVEKQVSKSVNPNTGASTI